MEVYPGKDGGVVDLSKGEETYDPSHTGEYTDPDGENYGSVLSVASGLFITLVVLLL